jgi:hypothetical protein
MTKYVFAIRPPGRHLFLPGVVPCAACRRFCPDELLFQERNGIRQVVGSLPGDQVFPDVAVTTSGGFVVWQDNATDGSGWGISARRLDSTLSGTLSTFPRESVQGTNDQENPRVALLKNGGAVLSGRAASRGPADFCALFDPTNTFLTTTNLTGQPVHQHGTNNFQINPAVAVLNDSNVVVVWASFDQAGSNSLLDVYGQNPFSHRGRPSAPISHQPVHRLQPAHAGDGGVEKRRVRGGLGFRAGARVGARFGGRIRQLVHRRPGW